MKNQILSVVCLSLLFITSCCDTPSVTGKDELGHKYVDLGLSVKWATCNIGDSIPSEYGAYYAWAVLKEDNAGIRNYTWGEFSHHISVIESNLEDPLDVSFNADSYSSDEVCGNCNKMMKYNEFDKKVIIEQNDDVASTEWGKDWRIPTKEEWDELLSKCSWDWKKLGHGYGYKVTASNGNWIFLPAAGAFGGSITYEVGSSGLYWSSTLDTADVNKAFLLTFDSNDNKIISYPREDGCSIRPVRK